MMVYLYILDPTYLFMLVLNLIYYMFDDKHVGTQLIMTQSSVLMRIIICVSHLKMHRRRRGTQRGTRTLMSD